MTATPALLTPPGPRLNRIRRIAVLRGGGLGDVLFAIPAIEALAAAYPRAEIELLGTPLHTELFADRPGPVAWVHELPFVPGVRPPANGRDTPPDELFEFFDRMRAREFDLAVQIHGGGGNSNPFLVQLGARTNIGLQDYDAPELHRTVPYRYYQHEMLRALEVAALVGSEPVMLEPHLQLTDWERANTQAMRERAEGGSAGGPPLVVLHPGATDPRRRWPIERFAELAVRLIRDGAHVVVVGDSSERELADAIIDAARTLDTAAASSITDLSGELALRELIALLAGADLTIANDSGPRHLAQAVGCPTVSIYWVGNLINAGPLTRSRHRAHLGWTTVCPTCGAPQVGGVNDRCDHDPSFVADVLVDAVYTDAASLLEPVRTSSVSTSSQRDRNAGRP